jgi:hypothetical protein
LKDEIRENSQKSGEKAKKGLAGYLKAISNLLSTLVRTDFSFTIREMSQIAA